MDSLASLALATEAPTDAVLDLPPYAPSQPLLTPSVRPPAPAAGSRPPAGSRPRPPPARERGGWPPLARTRDGRGRRRPRRPARATAGKERGLRSAARRRC